MTTQRTQGEWKVNIVEKGKLYIEADQGKKWDNPTVCALYEDVTPEDSVTIGDWLKAFDNAEANARLIAAAPKLLEAAVAIVERSEGKLYNTDQETGETFVNLLLSAIAAAKGE